MGRDGKISADDPLWDAFAPADGNGDGSVTLDEIDAYTIAGKPFILDGTKSQDDQVVNRPFDKLHRLARGKKSKTYQDQTDQDTVSHFYGYIHTVEVSNDGGTQTLGEGQTIDATEGEAPSPPHESGPEAEQFRQELKDEFKNGDIPNQDDFKDVIDSKSGKTDVGLGNVNNDVYFNPKEYSVRLAALVAQAHQLLSEAEQLDGRGNQQKGAIADALHHGGAERPGKCADQLARRIRARRAEVH